ncbi:MAG: HAD family phosphatase [Lachnospiraceae bacterium]|nr:HAD family phosphatase [Lachnospiraceae bacterium]
MKLLFTDLDGTFLTDDKQVCQENRKAMARMTEAGHKIVFTSGRSIDSVMALIERLSLNVGGSYIIGFNGAQIADAVTGERLVRKGLPFDLTAELFAAAHAAGIHPQAYDDVQVVAERDTPALQRYCSVIGMDSVVVPDAAAYLREAGKESSKLLMIDYEDHEKLERFRLQMTERCGDVIDTFYSNPAFCEVVCKGVNKGYAVRELCRILNVPPEDTVSAGDEGNDIPMLRAAHTGCAVANATAEVKAAADYVTQADNNAGAVAEIIERYIA